jgi:hypothetical protein
MKHKRCPKGYHIERWSDGLYHVYAPSGECLSELSGRQEGIDLAWKDFINKRAKASSSTADATNINPETPCAVAQPRLCICYPVSASASCVRNDQAPNRQHRHDRLRLRVTVRRVRGSGGDGSGEYLQYNNIKINASKDGVSLNVHRVIDKRGEDKIRDINIRFNSWNDLVRQLSDLAKYDDPDRTPGR